VTKKLNSVQALSIVLGGGIVAIAAAGFVGSLAGFGLPIAAELVAGIVGMAAGARVA
jgi:hypothetical protein